MSPIGRNCSYEERCEFEKYDKVSSTDYSYVFASLCSFVSKKFHLNIVAFRVELWLLKKFKVATTFHNFIAYPEAYEGHPLCSGAQH